jgi:hypothetical protein
MSVIVKLIIGGWATTLVMFGFCALVESGKLLKIRESIKSWMENRATSSGFTPEEGLEFSGDDAA